MPRAKKQTDETPVVTDEMFSNENNDNKSEVTSTSESPQKTKKGTRVTRKKKDTAQILTITSGSEVLSPEEQEEIIWHEIRNAHKTGKILSGHLGGIEKMENGNIISVLSYKGLRIVIPVSEMMINLSTKNDNEEDIFVRQHKILGNMLGSEIDFIIKGFNEKEKSIVASRKEAMLIKRKIFYYDADKNGMYRIYEGRIVQARVLAVSDKSIRVDIFGVETSIIARDLSHEWLGSAHDKYNVGDEILVKIQQISRESIPNTTVKADVRSFTEDKNKENLLKCQQQAKYTGKIVDVHKGQVFVKLSNGANAVAHSCTDSKYPGKNDDVYFVITNFDWDKNLAIGIITRIFRHNL